MVCRKPGERPRSDRLVRRCFIVDEGRFFLHFSQRSLKIDPSPSKQATVFFELSNGLCGELFFVFWLRIAFDARFYPHYRWFSKWMQLTNSEKP